MPDKVKYKNFYLLLLLTGYFICNAILASHNANSFLITVGLAFTILISINMISKSKLMAWVTIPLTLLAIGSYLLLYTREPSANLYVLHFTYNGLFLMIVTVVEIRSIALQEEITLNTLLGAVCAYLLIGLTWSYLYMALSHANHEAFYPQAPEHSFRLTLDYFMYFSYSTLTTLGYGDIIPKSNLARTLAWMEATVGQVFMAVWISQLVATHIAQRIKQNRAS